MLDESNLEWLDLEDKLTAENAKDAEYISICIYTYVVHYVLRQRYPPARAQVPRFCLATKRHKGRKSAQGIRAQLHKAGGESWLVDRDSYLNKYEIRSTKSEKKFKIQMTEL